MSELVSLVLTVRPAQPVTLPGHLGLAAYALLLRWIGEQDDALARHWHDQDGPKPFTCSTLIGARRTGPNMLALSPDRPCWLRFTALDPAISVILAARRDAPPESVELDGVPLHVESATTDPAVHPWAGTATYEQIAAPYLLARQESPRRLKLAFSSPTAFRQRDLNMAVPLPDLVFGGLADRWNAFSPIAVSPEVRRYAEEGVALNSFRLRSRALPVKEGVPQVGAVGEAGYVAVRYDRYWMGVLGLLADFAFFAGVGRMTTVGMGQARRLSGPSDEKRPARPRPDD
ncbi:MAG: CRISPR system precrRNA processing endoribonuclease RAMP protein Cas6 [Anaerolineae bacterium]|nr:CRISPR system precrRNA processing endoribonuclease RAMP protein Cas6 [Anaerolineae bacterium]